MDSINFKKYQNILEKIYRQSMEDKGDSDAHLLTVFSIALASKSKIYLELGVRAGATTLPILLAAKINNGRVFSVDIQETEFICPDELKDVWIFQKTDAIEFLENWDKSKKVDFIYLDDWHSYDHVKKELKYIDQMVGPSSIILVHDLMYGGTHPFYHSDLTLKKGQWANGGVYRAVAELDQNFWEWSTLPWGNGLTILRKKYSSKYHKL